MIKPDTKLQSAINNLSIQQLNEMQLATLETACNSNDVVLLAPTGSGKTLGFLLPLLRVLDSAAPGTQALVLAPSRELSLQIEQVFKTMATGYKVSCCYGGHSIQIERNNLKIPPTLLIGTPGRIADHLSRGRIEPETIQTLILDEFDKSLEFGFKEEMSYIISKLSNINSRILTSATRMEEIPDFTGIVNPIEISYLSNSVPEKLALKVVYSEGKDKFDTLFKLICKIGNRPALVFCNHREAVERVSKMLLELNIENDIFHGGMEQDERERALIKFRNGSTQLLITTDLASRGLDIPEIEVIIHYQLPTTESAFVHRNGRTARMHASGTTYLVLQATDTLPDWINSTPDIEELPAVTELPLPANWTTLYIGAGKKDKINKSDIVGFLYKKGQLTKDELGMVTVLDNSSFAAVKTSKANKLVKVLRNETIKKKKIKIDISI